MCGIFGYIGTKPDAARIIHEGLKRLEYRGYDSWGIAVLDGKGIETSKKVGSIGDVDKQINLPESLIGIGHTRWATHGGISETNAHPHYSSGKEFALAQNGIVENYSELKKYLISKGYRFNTQTDTEVIVRLIEDEQKTASDLIEAVRKAFKRLRGRNTIILLTKNDEIIAARNGSPLVIGVDGDEIFFSSDTLSFANRANRMIVIDNGQVVYSKGKSIKVFDISSGKEIKYSVQKIDAKDNLIDKEGYPHFMLKEIHEEPYVIRQLLNQDRAEYLAFSKAIKKAKNVYTLGCGTAGIAAAQIGFYLRELAKIHAVGLIGGDALDYANLFSKDDLIISPSQSGETADALEILEMAKKKGVKIASYVNMQGSTMTRMSDYKFMAHAGPEVCVMSTKIFVSQIAWGYLLAKMIQGKAQEGIKNLKILIDKMQKYLDDKNNHEIIKKLAKELKGKRDIFLLGKYQNFNIVKEGMVKLIEGTYKHAHAIPAGDLKHYAITLMESGIPVIVAISEDKAKLDSINAVNEVRARGATVIGIAPKDYTDFDFLIKVPDLGETSAIMNIVPLQLLSYYMTVDLGHNVDKPRNIAKSVTVK